MNTPTRNYLVTGLVLALGLLVVLFSQRRGPTAPASSSNDPAAQCAESLAVQQAYLDREPYVGEHMFARYPARPIRNLQLAPLDINSSPLTREFRTRLREELDSSGVNFAGYYSVVGVGMTGWGVNYWIVDRRTGRAVEFPFHATFLAFDANSTLIIMNPRDSIRHLLRQDPEAGCYYLNQEQVSDLRPFYFEWKHDSLSRLAPPDLAPPVNTFWLDYMSGLPPTTPLPVARFVRETRKGVIAKLNRVPREGYNGFMLLEAFPGIEPADFSGVTTLNGEYSVHEGRLVFNGNGSLDAPSMTLDGMTRLLGNLARRLAMPVSTDAEVVEMIERIAPPN